MFAWYLLKIKFFMVSGRGREDIEKMKKTDRRKTLKYKQNKKQRIQTKFLIFFNKIPTFRSIFIQYKNK